MSLPEFEESTLYDPPLLLSKSNFITFYSVSKFMFWLAPLDGPPAPLDEPSEICPRAAGGPPLFLGGAYTYSGV
jgi:hypothetical protein